KLVKEKLNNLENSSSSPCSSLLKKVLNKFSSSSKRFTDLEDIINEELTIKNLNISYFEEAKNIIETLIKEGVVGKPSDEKFREKFYALIDLITIYFKHKYPSIFKFTSQIIRVAYRKGLEFNISFGDRDYRIKDIAILTKGDTDRYGWEFMKSGQIKRGHFVGKSRIQVIKEIFKAKDEEEIKNIIVEAIEKSKLSFSVNRRRLHFYIWESFQKDKFFIVNVTFNGRVGRIWEVRRGKLLYFVLSQIFDIRISNFEHMPIRIDSCIYSIICYFNNRKIDKNYLRIYIDSLNYRILVINCKDDEFIEILFNERGEIHINKLEKLTPKEKEDINNIYIDITDIIFNLLPLLDKRKIKARDLYFGLDFSLGKFLNIAPKVILNYFLTEVWVKAPPFVLESQDQLNEEIIKEIEEGRKLILRCNYEDAKRIYYSLLRKLRNPEKIIKNIYYYLSADHHFKNIHPQIKIKILGYPKKIRFSKISYWKRIVLRDNFLFIEQPTIYDAEELVKINNKQWERNCQSDLSTMKDRLKNNPFGHLIIRDKEGNILSSVFTVQNNIKDLNKVSDERLYWDNLTDKGKLSNNTHNYKGIRAFAFEINTDPEIAGKGVGSYLIKALKEYLPKLKVKYLNTATTINGYTKWILNYIHSLGYQINLEMYEEYAQQINYRENIVEFLSKVIFKDPKEREEFLEKVSIKNYLKTKTVKDGKMIYIDGAVNFHMKNGANLVKVIPKGRKYAVLAGGYLLIFEYKFKQQLTYRKSSSPLSYKKEGKSYTFYDLTEFILSFSKDESKFKKIISLLHYLSFGFEPLLDRETIDKFKEERKNIDNLLRAFVQKFDTEKKLKNLIYHPLIRISDYFYLIKMIKRIKKYYISKRYISNLLNFLILYLNDLNTQNQKKDFSIDEVNQIIIAKVGEELLSSVICGFKDLLSFLKRDRILNNRNISEFINIHSRINNFFKRYNYYVGFTLTEGKVNILAGEINFQLCLRYRDKKIDIYQIKPLLKPIKDAAIIGNLLDIESLKYEFILFQDVEERESFEIQKNFKIYSDEPLIKRQLQEEIDIERIKEAWRYDEVIYLIHKSL
ncbi:MAG: hypothetical protein NC903_02680, partial [Candidatus Omnitrophica bacterium]|nr:hypothetical protein [Candidatus Omnitrophota bacterium]